MFALLCPPFLLCAAEPGGDRQPRVEQPDESDWIEIEGRNYGFDESLPVLSKMLHSVNPMDRGYAISAAGEWGGKLRGSDFAREVIALYPQEKDSRVQVEMLLFLCPLEDPRAEGLFAQLADSTNEDTRVISLSGLALLRGAELVPQLMDSMLRTKNVTYINSLLSEIGQLTNEEFPYPPDETWASESGKEKYRRDFFQWWASNKDRFLKKTPQRDVTRQTPPNAVQSTAETKPATVQASPKPPPAPKETQQQPRPPQPAAPLPQPPPETTTSNMGRLTEAAVAVLALLGTLFWLARRK